MPTGPRRGGRKIPPNLRQSDNGEMCANCEYFKGLCALYNYPVNAGEVCDSWYPYE